MDTSSLTIFESIMMSFKDFMVMAFNKEALAIFFFLCVGFFASAVILFQWAIKTGQFDSLESAKFEVLDETV